MCQLVQRSSSAWCIFKTGLVIPLQSLFILSDCCMFPGAPLGDRVLTGYGLPTLIHADRYRLLAITLIQLKKKKRLQRQPEVCTSYKCYVYSNRSADSPSGSRWIVKEESGDFSAFWGTCDFYSCFLFRLAIPFCGICLILAIKWIDMFMCLSFCELLL